MQKYQEPFLTQTGDAAGYVSVLVQEYPGLATATIYSDDGVTPKANPMTTDGLGNAPFYAANGRYQLTISGSKVVTTTKTDIQLFDPADGAASSDIGYMPAGTGAVATDVQSKLRQFPTANDNATIVSDSTTDNTAAILSTAVNSGKKFFIIPPGTKYNRAALLAEATFPDDVVMLDFTTTNDFYAAGEATKSIGILSKDSAPDDTHWLVGSGHHPIFTTNNYGTAGTTSADERKASWVWAAGQFALGAVDKRGFRGAAIQQFTKESGASFWKWQIRSLAPWASIDGEYEYWESGQVIAGAGVYRLGTTSQQYVSAGAGTCGATPPTHTSGTVSDGGVSWTWIDSGDRTLFQVDEYGRWIFNQGTTGDATLNCKPSSTDPSGNFRFLGTSRGVSKSAQLRLTPTDAASAEVAQPFLRAEDALGLRVMKSDASKAIASFSDTLGTTIEELRTVFTTTTSNDTTPTVDGIGTLYINNGGVTSVTALDDGSDGQIVRLVFGNANTTMVSSSTLLMAGSINVTPSAFSVITMLKVPNSISNRWIEMSRSIK